MNPTPKLADVILDLCRNAPNSGTIDPIDAAKAYVEASGGGPGTPYQRYLDSVRETAVKLARDGQIVIYRKGVPADPDTFKGVYRLGLANNA
jgi:hypothetical protein